MSNVAVRFPNFGEAYDALRMRELVRHLENIFSRIQIDSTIGAYSLTGNHTLGVEDELVLMDTTAGNLTATLPLISDSMVKTKREFEVVKSATANTLTIVPTGTDTILGEPDAIVTVQWTALRFRATAGNWVVI